MDWNIDRISIAIFTISTKYYNYTLILLTYPLKPLRLLIGDAVVAAEFSVDNVKSVTSKRTKERKRNCEKTWKMMEWKMA